MARALPGIVPLWSGAFELGAFWAGYRGPSDQNAPHAHVAIQLAIGFDDDVVVRSGGIEIRARALAIPPLVEHQVASGHAQVLFLYLEPHAPLGRALALRVGRRAVGVIAADLVTALTGRGDLAANVEALGQALAIDAAPALDARLEAALTALREIPRGPGALARAAGATGISESRLRALAKSQLGVPLVRWLLWRKLEGASRALAGGATFADAAEAGGFADQAHLARTMRRMFGITPSAALAALR